jgi:hypothetical protein
LISVTKTAFKTSTEEAPMTPGSTHVEPDEQQYLAALEQLVAAKALRQLGEFNLATAVLSKPFARVRHRAQPVTGLLCAAKLGASKAVSQQPNPTP